MTTAWRTAIVLAAATVSLASLGTSSASATPPTAPQTLTNFDGVKVWGTGANKCSKAATGDSLIITCQGIKENTIGSNVIVEFDARHYNATVESIGYDGPLHVTEQTNALFPIVFHEWKLDHKAIELDGSSVPEQWSGWAIGLDGWNGHLADAKITVHG